MVKKGESCLGNSCVAKECWGVWCITCASLLVSCSEDKKSKKGYCPSLRNHGNTAVLNLSYWLARLAVRRWRGKEETGKCEEGWWRWTTASGFPPMWHPVDTVQVLALQPLQEMPDCTLRGHWQLMTKLGSHIQACSWPAPCRQGRVKDQKSQHLTPRGTAVTGDWGPVTTDI